MHTRETTHLDEWAALVDEEVPEDARESQRSVEYDWQTDSS
ncbi:hypothetical protein [Halorientalis litorea]|jgi:hypothetical protein|nr:hypothetical protein [Halorientalis litorea]